MKLNINDILYNAFMEENTTLTIDYTTASGAGKFTINNMRDVFPMAAGKMKIIIDMINRAADPMQPATVLYNYLKKCADYLTELRAKIDGINDEEKNERAQLTNAIKKYTANIETLCKYFEFERATDPDAVKMTKTEVVTLEFDRYKNKKTPVNKKVINLQNAVMFSTFTKQIKQTMLLYRVAAALALFTTAI